MESKDFVRINPDTYNADVSPLELGPEVVNYLVGMRPNAKKLTQVGGDVSFLQYPINFHPIGGGPTTPINELTDNPYAISNISANNDYTWLIAGINTIQALVDDSDIYDISPAGIGSGGYINKWIIENFNSVPIFNRNIEQPYYWDLNTANRCLPLPGWPVSTICRSMRAFKNHLIGLNIFDNSGAYPDQVIWSNAADAGSVPPDWDFANPGSLAGTLELSDTKGAIVDAFPFRGSLLIYKSQAVYRLDYVGPPFVFSVSLLFDSFGTVAPNCVVEVFGGHIVLTESDLIFHDGHQPRSLLKGRIKERFNELINTNLEERYKSFLFHYFDQNEVWVYFITGDNTYPNVALIYNYVYDNFSFFSPPTDTPSQSYGLILQGGDTSDWDSDLESWDSDTTLWDSGTAGGAQLHIMKGTDSPINDIVVTDVPTVAPAKSIDIIRNTLSFPPERAMKFLYRVYIDIKTSDAAAAFTVAIGTQFEPEDTIAWGTPIPFTADMSHVDVLIKGRYFSYILHAEGQVYWELRSLGFTIKTAGEF